MVISVCSVLARLRSCVNKQRTKYGASDSLPGVTTSACMDELAGINKRGCTVTKLKLIMMSSCQIILFGYVISVLYHDPASDSVV